MRGERSLSKAAWSHLDMELGKEREARERRARENGIRKAEGREFQESIIKVSNVA